MKKLLLNKKIKIKKVMKEREREREREREMINRFGRNQQ